MINEIEKLREENKKLKKISASKSDLMSILGHELRTSLSALKWILKMFVDKDLGEITLEQESFIKKALISNNRMIDLVNKLLMINHSDELDIPFNFINLNILKIIDQVIFEFSSEAHKKGIELIFLKPDKKIPDMVGDEEMLRVVFQNLIENAIKYEDKNDKVFISLKYNQGRKNIEISIRDTGIGISEKDQTKIFTKFFRGSEAIKKDKTGTGLGLFAVKNIIEHHKGKIWLESTLNIGTTFFIRLPISLN